MTATMQRGDKFFVPLDDSDDEHDNNAGSASTASPLPGAFVNDVLERKPVTATPPTVPKPKNSQGFPSHRTRSTASRFKQQQQQQQQQQNKELNSPSAPTDETIPTQEIKSQPSSGSNLGNDSESSTSWEQDERRRIDAENRARLADMSPRQIEEERHELMESLSPAFLQKLLQRSNIDSGSAEADLSRLTLGSSGGASDSKVAGDDGGGGAKKTRTKMVSFADQTEELSGDDHRPHPRQHQQDQQRQNQQDQQRQNDHEDLDAAVDHGDEDIEESTTNTTSVETISALPHDTVHFPKPQQPPDLDPNSPNFLTDLHSKYFPTLPSDPSKLDWMRDVSDTTTVTNNSTNPNPSTPSPYSPDSPALHPKDLRFSFTGALLAPRTSASIPVSAGLHHHSLAPGSAGYTISELAHLSHSAFAAQRCLAFQTLGRVLFRLGIGEFGDAAEAGEDTVGAEETFGELARGIWREVGREKVLEGLVLEAEGNGVDGGRHVSARAYATEAVWLWRRGGGRRWKAD